MDLQNRTPQPGMRPDINDAPARPQQYANAPTNRPSIDGLSPPTAPVNTQPTAQANNQSFQAPDSQQTQPQVLEPIHHHRSSKPVVLAIITLLIAAALAVTAFFAFRPETSDKINKVNSPTSNQSTTTPSTSEQIDSATSEMNKQVDGLNDAQDFSDTELTDKTLGL